MRPRLRGFLILRSPRCEWPGCGGRAEHCDLDHDDAWPTGPTCACNLGALSRRHHRVKQSGWRKQRLADGGVRWTSPTGREYLSPSQHPPVPAVVRALPTLEATWDDDAELDPAAREREDLLAEPGHPAWASLNRDPQPGPNIDVLAETITGTDLRWTLALRDPYLWLPGLPPGSDGG